jgi:pantoate--beta-alanine ligase
MGYLHAGHSQLMDEARRENDLVVASIFVNPTQFGPAEDFERYPHDLERDREVARAHGVDILFVPTLDTIYPGGVEAQKIWVDPGDLAAHLEGAARPGHFRGVTTVVGKLLNLVGADRVYFGQKDAQQALIIAQLIRDLAFPVEMRIVPTVREPDGLALSSRNVYLSAEERPQATALFLSLQLARDLVTRGDRDPAQIEAAIRDRVQRIAPLARIDYVSVADLTTLHPLDKPIASDLLISLAVLFDKARLIDNIIVRFSNDGPAFS